MKRMFKQYKRKGLSEMRPYIKGEDLTKISVAAVDDPETDMGMVARNPQDHEEQWYVARKYFRDNLEVVETKENRMNFGEAIEALKEGKKCARAGWNGVGIFIELQVPEAYSKMTSPYTYIDTTGLRTDNPNAPKARVPWLASQTDMLAVDWGVFDD